ncbi:NAD(P)H-dependent oxidoreductase [Alicyclobacillus kakegawensis]|uniref:NAD(P)H-dependent oxidoreductase n=1 Tax=Alicyclobacillus kakegawensis TaxID=392012 RepID=UPI00082AEE34|nr:NAD(P)H-dependent oxidoreductase [Alicyclobacillus kakegawensis]
MNVLVIYAHPNPNSFNAAIREQIERGLREGGHSFTVVDLYKDNFNPVLVIHDQMRRSNMKDDPETAHYRELIRQADHLIFIYPVWWYGTPAILKGFFDRVLASGFAFTYDGLVPKGLLRGKSAWVFYTIDSPRWYARLVRRNAEWVAVGEATLRFCGLRPVKRFVFSGVKRSTERRRHKWLDRVYRQVRYGLT